MVLETLPGAGGEGDGGGDAVGGEVGEGGVVGLAVVHEDGVLAADAEMLVGALGWVGHDDEGDVVGRESGGGFPGEILALDWTQIASGNLQPDPDVDISFRDSSRSEEDMSTIPAWTCDLDGVRATVSGSGIQSDCTPLF